MRCYLFDIDGTLADLSHRLPHIKCEPKNWDAFFDACHLDTPIEHICALARALNYDHPIVFVSGRSDRCREKTERWLWAHNIRAVDFRLKDRKHLYMRREGDHRPDDVVKAELLGQLLADGWEPIMAFEDRARVVKMWRERGIPCCQVADGDF